MRFQVDPNLMEEAVFLSLRPRGGSGAAMRAFDERREALYQIPGREERDAAFAALNAGYFAKLDLAAPVRHMLDERPLISAQVSTFLLHRVFSPKEEGAELFGRKQADPGRGGYNGLLRLRPETLLNASVLERLCRHEFLHLADMLDPSFEYDHAAPFVGTTAAQQNLMRDRFVALWDLRIDAQLAAEGHCGEMPRERHAERFRRLFGTGQGWDQLFTCLYEKGLLSRIPHRELLASSTDPFHLPHVASLEPDAAGAVAGSAPCPLCGFPTRVWADQDGHWPESVVRAVIAGVPQGSPERRICKQCYELLAADGERVSRRNPSTFPTLFKEVKA